MQTSLEQTHEKTLSAEDTMVLDILSNMSTLIDAYAGLVKKIAHHVIGRMPPSISLDDMLQAGMLGLIEASQKYDPTKGASFETYASIRIRGAMLDEIRKGDWVPRSVHRNSRLIAKAIRQVENRMGRSARDHEIAQELGMPQEEYYSILNDTIGTRLFNFSELSEDQEDVAEQVADLGPVEPLSQVQNNAFKEALGGEIQNLPEREKQVLYLYYEEELNLREIGQILGVSESRVSQIHTQAAHRLKARLKSWRI
jgi:RNA polymerase sigma factor for flagellar operon FliA